MASDAMPNQTPDLLSARAEFSRFLERVPRTARCVALHDVDADGLAAGVLWQRTLERLGYPSPTRVVPDRERSAWTSANQERVASAQPEALWVLDLGSQPQPVLPGVPTCFVDHHRPGPGVPPGDTLISAYNWEPTPTTALLMWELCRPLAEISDLEWITAVGLMGDLGENAPFPMLTEAKRRYTAKYLKETVALVNAARRSSQTNPEVAVRALLAHPDPKSLVLSEDPDVAALRGARAEVSAALAEARKAAPVFSGNVALIRVHSRCQVHPLIAQQWRTRLPRYVVIAANDDYLPGRVNFSARAAEGTNVLDFLRAIPLPPGEGNFGQGHDQASGGSLPTERWNALLAALGFPERYFSP